MWCDGVKCAVSGIRKREGGFRMAKKELTADAKIKNWEKKMSKKLDFLIVGIFFLIFAATAVLQELEAKGITVGTLKDRLKDKRKKK